MRRQTRTSNQSTCYVIAYDIPDDKRRTKIHKVLLGFGKWTQYSLFECFLNRKDLILLRSKLAEHLVAQTSKRAVYQHGKASKQAIYLPRLYSLQHRPPGRGLQLRRDESRVSPGHPPG